jgi:hypothetical protein
MWIYILLLFLPIIFTLISSLTDKNTAHFSKIVFLLLVIFFIGSRYNIGGDWTQYNEYFNASAESNLLELLNKKGPSYAVLNYIVSAIGGNIILVNFISASVFIYGFYKFCNNIPNYWDAYLISVPYILIVVVMGYTRQSIALGLVFLALSFYKNRSLLKYVVAVLIGATFHVACLIMLPFSYFFVKNERPRVNLLKKMLIAILFTILIIAVILFNYQYILDHYISIGRDSTGAYFRLFIHFATFALFIVMRQKYKQNYDDYRLWMAIGISAFLLLPIIYFSSTIYDRLILYFLPFQVLIWSRLIYLSKIFFNRIIFRVFIYLSYFSVLIIWLNYANNRGNWLPYQSVFFL